MLDKTWVTSGEAARIMSEKNGRTISAAYVRLLGRRGSIRTRQLDERTSLFSRADSERYIVKEKPKTRAPAKSRATGRPPGRPRKEQPVKEEEEERQPLDIAV